MNEQTPVDTSGQRYSGWRYFVPLYVALMAYDIYRLTQRLPRWLHASTPSSAEDGLSQVLSSLSGMLLMSAVILNVTGRTGVQPRWRPRTQWLLLGGSVLALAVSIVLDVRSH